jgi:hypothetical protein
MAGPNNPFRLMQKQYQKPFYLPGDLTQQKELSPKEQELIRRIGMSLGQFNTAVTKDMHVSMARYETYFQVRRALDHWLVGAAAKLYANYVTNYSQLHDATVWATTENNKYEREIRELFERIHIEEVILDWAYNLGAYGDLFVKINAAPGVGVISISDDDHPLNVSRIDIDGVLAGFYPTPLAGNQMATNTQKKEIIPPWEYVHFRLLGARKERALGGDPLQNDFRSIHLLGGASDKQISSKYGTSLLLDALPAYKRLRLAEDSVLLARLTRGILRYIYKIKVDQNNSEAVAEIMDQYTAMLKNARALNTDQNSPTFDSKSNPFAPMEDLLLPVWGDTGDISIEKIGGDVDIRWIVDLDGLRNQCAAALKCPLCLLGAYIQEVSGSLGDQAIEQLDIGFARTSRRLQRALIEGITRIVQIHLSYLNMDPDLKLFSVHMAETSTAEEESLKKGLNTGVSIVEKFMKMVEDVDPDLDKKEVFNYLNKKILKLEDFNLNEFQKITESKNSKAKKALLEAKFLKLKKQKAQTPKRKIQNSDLLSYLPISEHCIGKNKRSEFNKSVWEKKFGGKTIEIRVEETKK